MNDRHGQRARPGLGRRDLLRRGLALGGAAGLLSALPPVSARAATLRRAAATAPVPQPRRGGTLLAALDTDPVSLDPHTNSNFSSLQAFDHIYESLTSYDERMNVVPALAEAWEMSSDGRTYTFRLREGVTFHNGQPLTAEDVKYSLDRVLDPATGAPYKSWLGPTQEVRAVNARTVELRLEEPFPALLSGLAGLRGSSIVPAGFAETANTKISAVGTGPFKLVEYVPQDHITYARNPTYWNSELPYVDTLTIKILPDENSRLAALLSGQVLYAGVSPAGAEQLKSAPGVTVLSGPYAWVGLCYINVSRAPMDDVRVRRALRMAVDTQQMIQKAAFGAGVPSGPIPTGYGEWFLPQETLPYLKPDPDSAKRLLTGAGYPDGRGVRVQIKCSPQYPEFVAIAQIMQDAWRAINVEAEIVQLEWGNFVKDYQAHDYQIAVSANTFRPDPDGYIYPYFHPKGVLNAGGYQNDQITPKIERARTISDLDERKRLYREIQQVLVEECPNYWWYSKLSFEVLSNRVSGYTQSFTGRQLFFKTAWLTD